MPVRLVTTPQFSGQTTIQTAGQPRAAGERNIRTERRSGGARAGVLGARDYYRRGWRRRGVSRPRAVVQVRQQVHLGITNVFACYQVHKVHGGDPQWRFLYPPEHNLNFFKPCVVGFPCMQVFYSCIRTPLAISSLGIWHPYASNHIEHIST